MRKEGDKVTMTARVVLSERAQQVKQLVLEGKTPQAIAAASGLALRTVRYQTSLLRKLGELPYARPPKPKGDPGPMSVDGIPAATAEEIRIITCPKCKTKVQVL